MSSWGCPHEVKGKCVRVNSVPCDPGMKGCVLFGRFRWADESKNRPRKAGRGGKQEESPEEGNVPATGAGRAPE
jgi:hypothetical protein